MRQLLLIDSLDKLNIKKDTSLMLALTLQKRGIETYLLFEKDFGINNCGHQQFKVYSFEGSFQSDHFYIEKFLLAKEKWISLDADDILHMRLDPPFDSRYLRVLWMLDSLSEQGIKVMNNPRGIMNFNEKLYAYRTSHAAPTYVGESLELCELFLQQLSSLPDELILKPMDLFSGIGVDKIKTKDWKIHFSKKVQDLSGPVIVQPFLSEVYSGELRSLYFKGQELGTILKRPKNGEFLSNIAQGALFEEASLTSDLQKQCYEMTKELQDFGVDWVAFDILGHSIQEVNITCPGLLVEVSMAKNINLCEKIIDLMLDQCN